MFRKVSMYIFLVFLSLHASFVFSQDQFRFLGKKEQLAIPFKLINNLIILPVEVNGNTYNFLLDTGVDRTIMFNISVEDSLKLKSKATIRLRGLGEGDYINAIRSENNFFKISKIINGNHKMYLIPGKGFDLSSKLGLTVNGIIGGNLFKDFIVDINYSSKKLKFYSPKSYTYKDCKKCQTFDLEFYRSKPYMYLDVETHSEEKINAKLLIDLGGSDALWLFDKSSDKIELPDKYFEDYLGKGLSGNIYGKRSKIDKIALGNYIFTSANVAYPDSTSIGSAYKHKERNGTLGSEILKRFRIIFDYPNSKITFRNVSKYFDDPFVYNMSGIELSHNGSMIIPERQQRFDSTGGQVNKESSAAIEILYSYVYSLKPSYIISDLRKDSPAKRSGLQTEDVLYKINGKAAYDYKLEEILHIFSTKPGKKIKLVIIRDGKELTYSFELEKML